MVWNKSDFNKALNEMLKCEDFAELEKKYGNKKQLLKEFQQAKAFAPDPVRLIEKNIKNLENILEQRSASSIQENIYTGKVHYDPAAFEKIGYAWVTEGYNATQNDIESFVSAQNITLNEYVTEKDRPRICYATLVHLAKGGSIAFHIEYLKTELKRLQLQNLTGPKEESKLIHSFSYANKDVITSLFDAFKKHGFIKTDCKKTDFNKLFSKRDLHDFIKIEWRSSLQNLHYFIQKLRVEEQNRYEIAASCFTLKGQNIDPKKLKNNKAKQKKFGALIDKILSNC